jgi:hypothetical protein
VRAAARSAATTAGEAEAGEREQPERHVLLDRSGRAVAARVVAVRAELLGALRLE